MDLQNAAKTYCLDLIMKLENTFLSYMHLDLRGRDTHMCCLCLTSE